MLAQILGDLSMKIIYLRRIEINMILARSSYTLYLCNSQTLSSKTAKTHDFRRRGDRMSCNMQVWPS